MKLVAADRGRHADDVICCDKAGAEFAKIDISGYDISFDAKEIVFSGKLVRQPALRPVHPRRSTTGSVEQIPTDPGRDYIIADLPPRRPHHVHDERRRRDRRAAARDEYERGTTLAARPRSTSTARGEELGPRNLSHRTFPTLASDGRVMFTQWDHLGPDQRRPPHVREPGHARSSARASARKAPAPRTRRSRRSEISPGRFVAIATSRDRTIQAGALIDIRLGTVVDDGRRASARPTRQSEANATFTHADARRPARPRAVAPTPSVATTTRSRSTRRTSPTCSCRGPTAPSSRACSAPPACRRTSASTSTTRARQPRRPILDDPEMWDIFARPLQTRTAPPVVGSAIDAEPRRPGADRLDERLRLEPEDASTPGSIYGVRVMEGFSSEEGFPEDVRHDDVRGPGQPRRRAGRARTARGSRRCPANVPLAPPGDRHVRHVAAQRAGVVLGARRRVPRVRWLPREPRERTTVIDPGLTEAVAIGPTPMFGLTPRAAPSRIADLANANLIDRERRRPPATRSSSAWRGTRRIQPMFDAKCISCHDANNTGRRSRPTRSPTRRPARRCSWTFNLTGAKIPLTIGGMDLAGEWLGLVLLDRRPRHGGHREGQPRSCRGNFKVYMNPQDARDSIAHPEAQPDAAVPDAERQRRAFTDDAALAGASTPSSRRPSSTS